MSIIIYGGDKMPGKDGTGPLGLGYMCNRRFGFRTGGRISGRCYNGRYNREMFSYTSAFLNDQTVERSELEEQLRFYENQIVDLKKRIEQTDKKI